MGTETYRSIWAHKYPLVPDVRYHLMASVWHLRTTTRNNGFWHARVMRAIRAVSSASPVATVL